jgi:hypothetical protein
VAQAVEHLLRKLDPDFKPSAARTYMYIFSDLQPHHYCPVTVHSHTLHTHHIQSWTKNIIDAQAKKLVKHLSNRMT